MKKQDIVRFFTRLQKADPSPAGELFYTNPYTLLVAVVLSAQATDKGVNKATPALFAKADSAKKMVALGEDTVRDYIKTIGLFRNKAKHVIALSKKLVEDYNGRVPEEQKALESLAGVGRKTANVVRNIAFGHPVIAVDTHIFRVANRTGLASGSTVLAVEEKLMARVPKKFLLHAHHWLILHGRYTCKARKPACMDCGVKDLCTYGEKTVV